MAKPTSKQQEIKILENNVEKAVSPDIKDL